MKLQGPDGLVRTFRPSFEAANGVTEAICLECFEQFGANDLKFTKPRMKNHICDPKARGYAQSLRSQPEAQTASKAERK